MDPEEISIEDRLEAALGKQYGEPAAEKVAEEKTESLPDDSPEEPEEVEAEASPEDKPAEDDSEEVEYEGAHYKVPKELKEALLRQSDYTRKTQDVAKQRQAYEALNKALQQEQQFHQAAFSVAVEARALESQIKRYDGLDWGQLADSDPTEFLKLDRAYRALKEQHAAKSSEAQQSWQKAQQEAGNRREAQAAKAHEELSRDIQGWGTELQTKIAETGKSYGFTEPELGSIIDPRMVKVLHDAHKWRALQAGKSELAKKVLAARPVTAPSARTSQSAHDASKYTEVRTALKKHGRTEDAERALEMRFAKKVR